MVTVAHGRSIPSVDKDLARRVSHRLVGVDPEARFASLVRRAPGEVPLDEAALCIAAAGQPQLDIDEQLARLDDLAARCERRSIEGVCELLFERLGLTGARDHYDDPRHSWLDQVLDRRVGIPISLAVITIEIARRVGVAVDGVGMPGHFLVRDPARPATFLDVHDAGRHLNADGCRALYRRLFGAHAPWSSNLLAPTPPVAILARMLANLTGSYQARDDARGRLWVARMRSTIPNRPAAELVALADELAMLGPFGRAADLLDTAAATAGLDDHAGERMRVRAAELRARLN
jgi:regulator of sirC expression with transglutaminase-like and TPR domain